MGLFVAATFSRKLNLLGGRGGQEGHPARTPTTRLPGGGSYAVRRRPAALCGPREVRGYTVVAARVSEQLPNNSVSGTRMFRWVSSQRGFQCRSQ